MLVPIWISCTSALRLVLGLTHVQRDTAIHEIGITG